MIIIGAGVVGAACAWYATRAGLRVTVLDRGPVAGGTTGAGEGNLLVSDKPKGPELNLALHSVTLWRALAHEIGGFEYQGKGGLVVAHRTPSLEALEEAARGALTITSLAEESRPPAATRRNSPNTSAASDAENTGSPRATCWTAAANSSPVALLSR